MAVVRLLHHHEIVILQLRAFLAVIEEGSLHRAATRLSLSHSALSRQMQALENELGGKLLERSSTGVRPTAGGYALATKMTALLASYDGRSPAPHARRDRTITNWLPCLGFWRIPRPGAGKASRGSSPDKAEIT